MSFLYIVMVINFRNVVMTLKDVFFSGFTLVQLSLWYNVTDHQKQNVQLIDFEI